MGRLTGWADAHLVPQWRKAHHFLSIRAAALQGALLLAWAQMPDDMKQGLPSWLLPSIAIFVLVVGTMGVLVNQKSLKSDK
jgi:hypothetical protein